LLCCIWLLTFNSLSRDHSGSHLYPNPLIPLGGFFQLPLSGSPEVPAWIKFPDLVSVLSTPSLGITSSFFTGTATYCERMLSTPSLGITFANIERRLEGIQDELSTPSLGITNINRWTANI